jgi:LacI family transcriptional regulator
VKSDSNLVGIEAAHTLMRQGIYKSYAFAGYRSDCDWSRDRGDSFRQTLMKEDLDCEMFDIEHFGSKVEDKWILKNWLMNLKKPCGLFSACDDRAFEILDICKESKIKVPAEIGLIGVNNDPILCENTQPRLSSIQPDFIQEGRVAAELLERMMSGYHLFVKERLQKVGIRDVIHRESTTPHSKNGRLVQRILAYLNTKATTGIGVEDVAAKFKISRSLLELRFRELQGESVYEAILRIRLNEVKRRLGHSNETISEITAACGWKNPVPLKALFRKRFGISMREYRKQSRTMIH